MDTHKFKLTLQKKDAGFICRKEKFCPQLTRIVVIWVGQAEKQYTLKTLRPFGVVLNLNTRGHAWVIHYFKKNTYIHIYGNQSYVKGPVLLKSGPTKMQTMKKFIFTKL